MFITCIADLLETDALAIWTPHLAWALLMLVLGRRRDGGSGGFHGGGGATGRW